MRVVAAALLTCVLAAGCAVTDGSPSVGTNEAAATGSCGVMFENDDIAVIESSAGGRYIVAKRLAVVDVRMTQGQRTEALRGTRFWDSHLEYVLAPRIDPESLLMVSNMTGEQFPAATFTVDTATGNVATGMQPSSARFRNEGENVIADLADATEGPSPVLNNGMRRSFLSSFRINATAACDNGRMPIVLGTTNPATFEATKAKIFEPKKDLLAIDQFIATANAIRSGDRYRENLTKVGPEVATKMTAFADLVDRDIRPFANDYGTRASRPDFQAKVNAAWTQYLDLADTVLKATNATVGVDALFVKNGDGSYGMNTQTPALANELLPGATAFRGNVEGVLAERGALWTERALQP